MPQKEVEQFSNSSKEFLNSLSSIVWRMDSETHSLIQINSIVYSLLGYTAEECLENKTLWDDILHEDDKVRLANKFRQGATFYDKVLRRRRKDGTYVWLREIVNIVEEKGKPSLLFGISLNASSVMQQRDDTQMILDSVPAMVWYKDTDNGIILVNKAAAASMGKQPEDLKGKSCWDIYPDEAEQYYKDDLSVINSGLPKIGILEQVLGVGGEKLWVQTDKIPCFDENGKVVGIICFVTDVTDNKLKHDEINRARLVAELSLKESEARLDNVTRHMPGLIYQFKIHADGSRSFPYMSESCRSLMEVGPEEVLANPELPFDIIHIDDRASLAEAIQESKDTLQIFKWEGRLVTRSGRVRWVQASSTPTAQSNGDVLWNGMMMDISDLKMAQDKIKHLNQDLAQRVGILAAVNRELELLTHKLEVAYDQALQASRLKSEFVANISHEVRTPISAVIGMSDLLLDTALSDEQKQFAKIVRESAESLLTIINDILDFSKIEAGKVELEFIEFEMHSILESCAELLSSTARRKGLELVTEIDPQIPRTLSGDPVRLRQILLNLASNAIKFTERGEVVLRAVRINSDDNGQLLIRIEVSDTGIGVSEEARRLLFHPFVQADGSTTRRYGGTGLGLSICKNLVELMSGEIGVQSKEGEGSTFWFTVPFSYQQEPNTQGGDLNEAKVLVVDQTPATRVILENYFSAAKIQAKFVTTKESTFASLNQSFKGEEPYNIIIFNLANETIDGFDLARHILETPTLSTAKLIFLTSFDERDKVNKALSMGVSACLTKPIRQAQLIDTIRSLCRRDEAGTFEPFPNSHQKFTNGTGSSILSFESKIASDAVFDSTRANSDEPAHDKLVACIGCTKPILLAEDNPVMQELGVRQLKKMGIEAHPVSSGVEVVKAIKAGDYALILMDCQMPDMDGFEATRAIRELEKSTGKHIPIIAMTASAMRGDRENCIASGMDDYMSKPVGKQQLIAVLERWLGKDGPPLPVTMNFDPQTADPNSPINVVKLTSLYGEQGMPELLHSFLGESEKLIKSIKHHISQRNDKDLATEAHQLKGLSAVMTVEAMEKLSQELERAARQSSWEQADEICVRLDACFETVTNFIKTLLE
ncbi:MAG TPA: response regulator [Drouetiella sp.]|jgi:two-component system, sensor histidine kinase and response regulator